VSVNSEGNIFASRAAVVLMSLAAAIGTSTIAVLVLAGGGHGWNTASLSCASILIAPAGGLAFSRRSEAAGAWLARFVVAAYAVVDVAILVLTKREGWAYVARAWQYVPASLLIWLVAWAALHAFPLVALHRRGPSQGRRSA
jgi:hypothetical protein